MALNDDLEDQKKLIEELKAEYKALNNELLSIASQIAEATKETDFFNNAAKRVANTYQKDLTNATSNLAKNNRELATLQEKQLGNTKLTEAEVKKLAKLQERNARDRKIAEEALQGLRQEGVEISLEQELAIDALADSVDELAGKVAQTNTDLVAQEGLTGAILENVKSYLGSLDKSGLAAQFLEGNLSKAQKVALAGEAAFIAIAKGALEGSDNIAQLEKNLGISYFAAYRLQNSLAITAASSNKLFITSKDLNKSFTDLAAQTGIISDFGGDTLVTMTALTKQLGLGVKEASQLALLARTQGEDTEGILDNTVATVNAVNKQRKSSISAKEVLNDIATASSSIVVSLGMSPEILAEAATEARALGISLEGVDKIAGSLLEFETSIENELKFQMLTGKEINLDKARQLALDNDLAGLSEEIAKNSEITEAFATGNRIQQQAAADALGMSRDELAKMVMQQEFLNLSQDEFIEKFGEQSYQQMQAQSASEKFTATMEKLKGIVADIGTIFSPIIDAFASLVGILAENKNLLIGIAAAIGTVAVQYAIMKREAIKTAIFGIFDSFSKIPGGFGIPLAIGATAGMIALANSSAQAVEDGIADSSRGPFTITDSYGKMAMTAKGDNLAVSPNINKGGNDNKMLSVLEQIAKKDSNVYMDSSKVGYAESLSYSKL